MHMRRFFKTIFTVNRMHLTDVFEENNQLRFALILLNGLPNCACIENRISFLWSKSDVQICADGAANRLRQIKNATNFVPKVICGDLDSCSGGVLQFYRNQGTEIVKIVDDSTTDFTKCVKLVKEKTDWQVKYIVILGGLCGRFDHVLGCLQTLYLSHLNVIPSLPVYLLHNESFVCIIPAGKNVLHINRKFCTGKCGLVPFGSPANQVTTVGLKWNLSNQRVEYGNLISTSNELSADEIQIDTDTVLLWTMEIKRNS